MRIISACATLAIASLALLVGSSDVGSSEYRRIDTPYLSYDITAATNHAEDQIDLAALLEAKVRQQNPAVPKIFRYFASNTTAKEPLSLAMAIANNSRYPYIMAAIAVAETGCNPSLVGSSGEQGMWQLMHYWRPANYSKYDLMQNLTLAERVLEVKLAVADGNLYKAVQLYNGTGPKARRYAKNVFKIVQEIKKTPT